MKTLLSYLKRNNIYINLIVINTKQLILVTNITQMNLDQAKNILQYNNINYEISYVKTGY